MTARAALASLLVSMLVLGGVVSYLGTVTDERGLASFRTRAEFHAYLEGLQAEASATGGFRWTQGGPFTDVLSAAETGDAEGGFSGTNVQVAGVDEADIVKSDGEFLYVAAGEEVVLIRAHPPASMGVASRIPAEALVGDGEGQVRVLGLFLYEGTLVVISSLHGDLGGTHILPGPEYPWPMPESRTMVALFSVGNPSDPVRLRILEFTGAYQASRMKEGVVYLVLHQPVWVQDDEAAYPTICTDGRCEPYAASRIYYDPGAPGVSSLTNVVAIDLSSDDVGYLAVLTGLSSTVYMSLNNLYVTFAKWRGVEGSFPGSDLVIEPVGYTTLHRLAVDGTNLVPAAEGDVGGWLLNQFSLDEHGGYLRVATTTWGGVPENNVYVLDPDLRVVGALEGLAPGESIYSARFVGDLGYLVTFEKVDPFFVLDLSNPSGPEVLGYLKIPGFSEYLHPIDETHVLGVGKDTIEDPSGTFAWFQGLKLSLFDVADLRAPKEVAKYLVGDRGSSSPVLHDHKALLYVPRDRLLVLPVNLVQTVDVVDDRPPWEHGTEAWQGALALSVDPVRGFEVRANITHVPAEEEACMYGYGPYGVTRSLYVGGYLYTLSPTVLKAHSLVDFTEASSLVYGEASEVAWC